MNENDLPLMARLAVAMPSAEDADFMVLPAGQHRGNFAQGNKKVTREVLIDEASAVALQRQLDAVKARSSLKPYFDFDHKDEAASAWPESFYFQGGEKPGVYVSAPRSALGREAIKGKAYQAFSMVFYTDRQSPARIICRPDADLNFGGLVNDPAFHEISPLAAKNAAGAQSSTNQKDSMDEKEMAALQAKIVTLEQENGQLKAKATTADNEEALQAKDTEITDLQAKLKAADDAIKAGRAEKAKDAVQAAVKRGALAAKDEPLQAKWQKWCTESPKMIDALNQIEGKTELLGGRITKGADEVKLQSREGPKRIIQAYGALMAKAAKIGDASPVGFQQRGEIAREMAALYAKDIRKNDDVLDMPLMAADYSDPAGNLGVMSGTLVAQRTVELFRYTFPTLGRVTTDFGDMPANFGQGVVTRIVSVPTVTSYDATTGWTTPAGTPTTTDVLVTLDEHIGVPIRFNANTLASTVRRLFDELAPAAAYSLGKYFVDKLYKLAIIGNFNGYAVKSTKVPTVYASYPVAVGDISRTHLTKIAAAMNTNEVPLHDRSVLLNSSYYAQLASDPSLVTFYAGQRAPEMITDNELPKLATFVPIEAPNFPSTANGVGLALQKAGLVALSRLSNDYTQALPGSSYGSVSTITNPDTGLSVVLVQYVDHKVGFAEWRIQVMMGAAVGDKRGGLVITSQ